MTSIPQKPVTKRLRRMAREPQPQQESPTGNKASDTASGEHAKPAPVPKGPSKNDAVLAMLNRPEGATLDQMVEATGWLPHTTRAVLTGFKKKGHSIRSEKVDGLRVYRIASGAAPA